MTPNPTRVLLISLHHPELMRGGAQQVCYELFQELRERPDVQAYLLASTDETTPGLFKAGARITGFDGREDEFLFLSRGYDHWWQKLGEPLLIDAFIEFLNTIRPDVVHFHHFMTFGIDLLTVTRRILPNCRIVFTFHEFMAICAANGHMVRRTDQSLCTQANEIRCHQCFPDRGPEAFMLRKLWFMQHFSHVDCFACPSEFMIGHYVDWGLPREKIVRVTNGQKSYAGGIVGKRHSGSRNRFGFFGQLHDVKGVLILLRAVQLLRSDGFTGFVLKSTATTCISPRHRSGPRSRHFLPPRPGCCRPNGWWCQMAPITSISCTRGWPASIGASYPRRGGKYLASSFPRPGCSANP